MAVNSKYNFEGGYENDTQAGMLHVASNHFSPGKKQWTWGNGDFGRAWDRSLTDKDERGIYRPYIELMAGVYTENQPDFTWLMPYEEKQFVQYFMPYREVGMVKNASKDLIFGIEETTAGKYQFKIQGTSKQDIHVVFTDENGKIIYDKQHTVSPEAVLCESLESASDNISLVIYKEQYGKERPVLTWAPEPDEIRSIPDAAEAALLPEQIKTNEQLLLTGQHIEQYRHATYIATDYYEEALRRDPNDIRCLNAMGLWYIRKGRLNKAEGYLRKAVKLSMKRNPQPYDGEPLYNLAICLKYQSLSNAFNDSEREKLRKEAYNIFWKVTWNKAWADAGYFEAAKISVMEERLDDAWEELRRCLNNNAHNQKALALKASVLRLMGKKAEVKDVCEKALTTDLFNYGCLYELGNFEKIKVLMHGMPNNYQELALDYAAAGLTNDVEKILEMSIEAGAATPMTYYYLYYFGNRDAKYLEKAEKADSAYCFPNRIEDIIALEAAIKDAQNASKAHYYLGCLYYDKRQYDVATEHWEKSREENPAFPTVWRNLALAYFNKQHNAAKALECMEKAFALDDTDARIYMELDQLYKRLGRPHAERLALMQQHLDMVETREDLKLEYATLLNLTGHYEEAKQFIDAHTFHVWEGGEGKVPAQYQLARTELAKKLIVKNVELKDAVRLLNECLEYPHHLGEGKLYGAQESDFYYFLGCAYEKMGDLTKARECWEEATKGPQEPAAAMYYNDAKPEKIFYQGLALKKLQRDGEANGRFYKLLNYGKQHIFDDVVMDYFAVSLPDLQIWEGDLNLSNQIHCKLMLALGYFGLGNTEKAEQYIAEVEALDPNHLAIHSLKNIATNKEFFL